MQNEPYHTRRGFTLVELSLVLVIIGLIAGGILTGSSLIETARIQATIKQYESFQTALQTFRLKYNCQPGDCVRATGYGFEPRSQAPGHGDGNNLYEDCTPGTSWYRQGCETLLFWRDLSQANMISGNFNMATDSVPRPTIAEAERPLYFPKAWVGSGYFMVYNPANVIVPTVRQYQNYMAIMDADVIDNIGLTPRPSLPPSQAYSIDAKLDDGRPGSGKIVGGVNQAVAGLFPGSPGGATDCAVDVARYNTVPPYAGAKLCVINFEMK